MVQISYLSQESQQSKIIFLTDDDITWATLILTMLSHRFHCHVNALLGNKKRKDENSVLALWFDYSLQQLLSL